MLRGFPKQGAAMKRKEAKSVLEVNDYSSRPSAARQKNAHGFVYEEATGKTIDYIRCASQLSSPAEFEIRFADGSSLFIEPVQRIQFRVRYLRASGGNIETLRDYGLIPE
jgi:hypothetical protein